MNDLALDLVNALRQMMVESGTPPAEAMSTAVRLVLEDINQTNCDICGGETEHFIMGSNKYLVCRKCRAIYEDLR